MLSPLEIEEVLRNPTDGAEPSGAYISSGSPSFDATAVVPRMTPEGSKASANSLAFKLSLSRTQWLATVMTTLRAMVRIAHTAPSRRSYR